jgi:hypothetical protein
MAVTMTSGENGISRIEEGRTPSMLGHWMRPFGRMYAEELPCQALSSKAKDKEWLRDTLDALEMIGIRQFNENMRMVDIDRMCEGRMTYMEISEVIPQLGQLDSMMSSCLGEMDYPRWLKHYDILGLVINAIVEWYSQHDDAWTVTSSDATESNEYERTATDLIQGYIREEFEKELAIRMLKLGINPEGGEGMSEEEQAAYAEQISATKEAMTPPEIQAYMKSGFRTAAVEWGNHVLKSDKERFQMAEMDKENMKDYLKHGRCFRNHHIGYDYYRPEVWSPINTFFSKSLSTKKIEDGEYAGRIHYYTPSEFVQRYGHKLTSKEIRGILGDGRRYGEGGSRRASDMMSFWGQERVPFESYRDYELMYQAQEALGTPLGELHSFVGGKEEVTPQFLPNPYSFGYFVTPRAQALREDVTVRRDMIQVTEAYWISWRKVYCITWMTDEGMVVQDVVTDELILDFLRERGIRKLRKSLDEYEADPEINSYVESWIPEVRYGVKATTKQTGLREDLYLYGDPIDVQVKGDSNVFDLKLPVTGIAGSSLAEKIYPYQCLYNLAMNQLYNLMEKEIGVFFLFDIGFIPNEFKQGKDMKDFMLNMIDIAKSIGLFGTDMSKSNLMSQGGANYFNQFQRVDLTNTAQMASRMQIAEFIYAKALSQVGLTPQALGTPVNYQTSTGVKEGLNSSFVQLQTYFDTFDSFKQRDWWVHLAIAQYCQRDGKDMCVNYTGSDLTKAYLHISDPDISLRTFDILPTTNSKRRRELEGLKQYMMQNNTMGVDELGLARIWTSDSMAALLDAVRESREYKEAMAQRQHENNLELEQKRQEFEAYVDDREHKQALEIEHTRGQYKVKVEEVQAIGRLGDKHSDPTFYNYLRDTTDRILSSSEAEEDRAVQREQLEAKTAQQDKDRELKVKELAMKAEEIRQRQLDREAKVRIAEINKN